MRGEKARAVRRIPRNRHGRDFVVGDIHGTYDLGPRPAVSLVDLRDGAEVPREPYGTSLVGIA